MIRRIVFVELGLLFFLQKQHVKRAALGAKRRAEAASKQFAHTGATDMTNAQNAKEARKTLAPPTAKPRPTSTLPQPTADAAETYAGSRPSALTSALS
jgi:hypothetical protein